MPKAARAAAATAAPPPPAPMSRGLLLGVALVAFACVAASVTFRINDSDLWQHLAVGRAIWELGGPPPEHQWTWPRWGSPEPLPSWLFRALVWPFWDHLGLAGLFAWRWLTALAAFGLAWLAARRLGATGALPLLAIVACALAWRTRSQVRPETLVAVLLALQILLLEHARRGGRPFACALGVAAIAWAWANAHVSWWLGLALTGFHLAAALAGADRRRLGPPLALALLGSAALSFANPYGARALAQPFEFFFVWRHEPIYQTIAELRPLWQTWTRHLRSGLPFLVLAWPVLVLWRPRRRPFDLAEALTAALLTALVISSQRFVSLWAVAAAPYLARALAAWAAEAAWVPRLAPARRAALVAAAIVLACVPEWTHPGYPFGVAFAPGFAPVAACDFMARAGVRGRGFNHYWLGGYQTWRFWPDRARLPFMDVHQSGTPSDRTLVAYAASRRDAWEELERRHRFDYALLDGRPEWVLGDRSLDFLDADPAWALVFRDDDAALYVRRDGALAALAESLAVAAPGGNEAIPAFTRAAAGDAGLRARARADLERLVTLSQASAWAHSHLATLARIDGDAARARGHLEAALAVDRQAFAVHRRLGYLELEAGRPREAIAHFERELALGHEPADLYLKLGEAWERAGDARRAARWYRREVARDPASAPAREALRRIEGGGASER